MPLFEAHIEQTGWDNFHLILENVRSKPPRLEGNYGSLAEVLDAVATAAQTEALLPRAHRRRRPNGDTVVGDGGSELRAAP